MIVISDTSAISALFLIDKLELLPNLYGKVIIPLAVMEELSLLETAFQHDITILKSADWLSVVSIQNVMLFQKYRQLLDEGESQALTLAQELKADLLLIDEIRGRKIAQAENIPHTGLLGVLLSAKAQGFLVAVQPVMDDLKMLASFRISDEVYKKVLEQAGE